MFECSNDLVNPIMEKIRDIDSGLLSAQGEGRRDYVTCAVVLPVQS